MWVHVHVYVFFFFICGLVCACVCPGPEANHLLSPTPYLIFCYCDQSNTALGQERVTEREKERQRESVCVDYYLGGWGETEELSYLVI